MKIVELYNYSGCVVVNVPGVDVDDYDRAPRAPIYIH
jgi:hypothetical protein